MKANEEYFPVVLFTMQYKVVQSFESVAEILKHGHSNESYWAVLSCAMFYKVVLVFESLRVTIVWLSHKKVKNISKANFFFSLYLQGVYFQ